ncbi:unnamed protein product [Brachionus calyciflorus]|uniref:Integrase catalytic domain-containing protein n=1 Tax=Brachionus calyciflorus TaxID=104777 RepID=A0A813RR42_9BILA|nr:unnamed protein product [Brachionus calyciflorus]
MIDHLLKLTGTERLTTSPYHPRTNGATERANQTIINCLRKHAEVNTNDWDKWLDIIQLAYNSRVHSTTGFTPYELMFGRKINNFESWKDEKNNENSLEILKRAAQLKKQYEVDIHRSKENVRDAQTQQTATQDKSKNIIIESFEPNTKNYVDELNGKESKNLFVLDKSPYRIDGFRYKFSKTEIRIKTNKSFFGTKSKNKDSGNEVLSRDECLAISISKRCGKLEMICEDDFCSSEKEPQVDYSWLEEQIYVSYHFFVTKIPIRGYTYHQKLFVNSRTSCLPKDLFCVIDTATYIWGSEIIHE